MQRPALGLAIALACTPVLGQAETFYLYCVGLTKVSAAPRSFISQVFRVSGADFLQQGTVARTLVEIEKAWGDFTGCDFNGDPSHCYCNYSETPESTTKSRTDYVKTLEDSLVESSSGQMNPATVRSIELPSDYINAAVAKGKAAR